MPDDTVTVSIPSGSRLKVDQADKDFVLAAVDENPAAFFYASLGPRADADVVLAAVQTARLLLIGR